MAAKKKPLVEVPPVESESSKLHPRPCPLGCGHVFRFGVNGWHHHVAPWKRHPNWHPEIKDPERRKAVFLDEFPKFLPKRGRESRAKRDLRIQATREQRMAVPGILFPRLSNARISKQEEDEDKIVIDPRRPASEIAPQILQKIARLEVRLARLRDFLALLDPSLSRTEEPTEQAATIRDE